jgi:hypothetical protein
VAILFSLIIIGLIKEFKYGEFLFLNQNVTQYQYRQSIEFHYVSKTDLLTLPNYSKEKIQESKAKINDLNLCIIRSPKQTNFNLSPEHNDYPAFEIKFSNLEIINNRNFLFYLMTINNIESGMGRTLNFEYFIFSIRRLWNILMHKIKEDWKASILSFILVIILILFLRGLYFTESLNLVERYLYFIVISFLLMPFVAIPLDLYDSLTITLFKMSIPIIFSLSIFLDYEFIKLFYVNSNDILSSMFFSLLFFGLGCLLTTGYIEYIKGKLVKIS